MWERRSISREWRPSPRQREAAGFTLVEVLVSFTILAFSIMFVMAALPEGFRQVTGSGRVSTMNHLAQQQIDRLKAEGYTHADLTSGSHPALASSYPVSGSPDYSLTWSVAVDSPIVNVKTVTVTVGYRLYDSSGNALPSGTPGQMQSDFQLLMTQ
jgi:type II secretory pathway pseudopilin PulG